MKLKYERAISIWYSTFLWFLMYLPFQGNIPLGCPHPWADLTRHLSATTQMMETLVLMTHHPMFALR